MPLLFGGYVVKDPSKSNPTVVLCLPFGHFMVSSWSSFAGKDFLSSCCLTTTIFQTSLPTLLLPYSNIFLREPSS